MSRSIQQLPNNSSTANAVAVPSVTGFAAGEYIYNQNNNYTTVQDNAVSTASFNINATGMANYANGMSGGIVSTWNNLGTSKYQRMSAVLTNGNVVTASTNGIDNYPKFRIDTAANVNVVAQTNISTTYTCYAGNIGVIALVGGGFVAFWNTNAGTAYTPVYAVYSNTGTVVTAPTQDTTFSAMTSSGSGGHMNAIALANGGFVLTSVSSANSVQYRIYNSTGVGSYSTATVANTAVTNTVQIGISARSDSSFCISYRNSTTTQSYTVISATNTPIVASTTITIGSSNLTGSSVATLSNDTFVIAYLSATSVRFRLLPTGNTLGSETTVNISPGPFLNYLSGLSYSVSVLGLSAGNFVIAFVDAYNILEYTFYSNTGTLLSATQANPCLNFGTSTAAQFTGISLIELPTTVNIFYPNGNLTTNQGSETAYLAVNKTTYAQVIIGTGTSATIASQTVAVNGYARNASTPSSASFFASANQTLTTNQLQTTAVTSATIATSVNNCYTCSLLNGAGFAVAYTSVGVLNIAIYNNTGVLQRTIVTNITAGISTYYSAIRLSTMSSGNIVVSTAVNSNCTLAIYSPTTGSLVSSTTLTNITGTNSGSNTTQGLCGISGDRFVFYYYNTSAGTATAAIYSNTCSLLNAYNDPGGGYGGMMNASATLTSPGFWVSMFNLNQYSYPQMYFYQNTSGNSFTTSGTSLFGASTVQVTGGQGIALANNSYAFSSSNGSTVYTNVGAPYGGAVSNLTQGITSSLTSYTYALNQNSYGAVVFVSLVQTATSGGTGVLGVASPGGSYTNTTLTGLSTGVQPQPSLTPLYDGVMALVWIDSSSNLRLAFINTANFSYSTNLVAGVTSSNTALNPTPTNGYVLSGVSVSSAPAGGTGLVQTSGLAKLNTNYNASQSTVSFDSTNPVSSGVRGSVTGLNVNMQGS